MIRAAWYAALVLSTLMVLGLLWQFGAAVVLFLLSLAVEAAFHPLVEAFQLRGMRRGAAVAISYGAALAVVGALVLLASGPLLANFQQVTDDISIAYSRVKEQWLEQRGPLLNTLAAQMPASEDLYASILGEKSTLALQTLFGAAEGTFGFLSRLVMVMALSVYWCLDHIQFERLWLSLLPVERRSRARGTWHNLQSEVGAYIRREVSLSLSAWILLWLGYLVLGIKYAALLALMGAVLRLIPWLGSLLVVFLPLLAGAALGWWAGPAAAVYTLIVFASLEFTLGRTIFPRRRYGSLLLVLFMIALADSFGLVGIILAPILAVTLQILFDNLLMAHANGVAEPPAQTLVNLQARIQAIRSLADSLDTPNSVEATSLATRLESLLDKTSVVMQSESEMKD